MPEIPYLEYIRDTLNGRLAGARIVAVEVYQPLVLRSMVRAEPAPLLVGRELQRCERHGPFLRLHFNAGLSLVCHFMLSGRFELAEAARSQRARHTVPKSACLALEFEAQGTRLIYHDPKRMGKLYLVEDARLAEVPRWASVGLEPLSAAFTLTAFQSLVRGNRSQVKSFLVNDANLGGIGNAYADEILFEAGLHPKTPCSKLDAAVIKGWYEAIGRVLDAACREVRQRAAPIEVKVRDFLKVRNRAGEPCPRCGTTIRRAGVRGFDAFFCPKCQPAQGKTFIDWSGLP